MLSIESGNPIAIVSGGPHNGALLGTTNLADTKALATDVEFATGALLPIITTDSKKRTVEYIAGPSGAGKSTYLAGLLQRHLKLHPEAHIVLFSRGKAEDDPAFEPLMDNIIQVELTQELVDAPPDVLQMEPGTILVFDDCSTIMDDGVRAVVEKLIRDSMEVGRKRLIHVLVTSHLVIPPGKKYAQVVLTEATYITLFPGTGSSQQATYMLKTHLGLSTKQAQALLSLRTRWVRIHTASPRFVMYEHGCYLL